MAHLLKKHEYLSSSPSIHVRKLIIVMLACNLSAGQVKKVCLCSLLAKQCSLFMRGLSQKTMIGS